jgi:O-antigen/teichoic acid export membrane protein
VTVGSDEVQAPDRPTPDLARSQVRGSAWLLGGQVFGVLVNLGAQILIVRHLSKAGFGAFAFALSVVAVGEVLATLGLRRGVSRFVPMHLERSRPAAAAGVLAFGVAAVGLIGVVLVAVVVALRDTIAASVDHRDASLVLAVLIAIVPVTALENMLDAVFAIFGRARLIAVRSYVYIPLIRLALVIGLIAGDGGVVLLAAGWVAAGALGVLAYVVVLTGVLRGNGLLQHMRRGRLELPARELLAFTAPMFTQDLAAVLTFAAPTLLLGVLAGAEDVADLRTVAPIALTMLYVRTSFALLFVPSAARLHARGDATGLHRLYWRAALWTSMFSLPVLLVAVPFAEPLTVFLFGDRYAGAAPVLAALVLGLFVSLALGPNLDLLGVYGRVRFVALSNLVAIAATIGLAAVLVALEGTMGAAIAIGASLAAVSLWWQVALARLTDVGPVGPGLLRFLAVTALACAALLGVRALADPPLAVGVVLALACTLGVLVYTREGLSFSETFPELARMPGLQRLLRSGREAG